MSSAKWRSFFSGGDELTGSPPVVSAQEITAERQASPGS